MRKIRPPVSVVLAFLMLPIAFVLPVIASAATKVAFVADQGVGSGAKAVLSLVREEDADILLVQGDLGYNSSTAAQWEQNLNDYLGSDFPVLALVGNHERREWSLYEHIIQRRVDRADGLSCSGRSGVKASCTFGNLQVVQVARGIYEIPDIKSRDDYDGFIRSSFNGSDKPWKVCAWHKNQYAMQTASKSDETGWDIYDACLDSGAMIAMGHAHTYSRTYLMKDYETQSVAHRDDDMLLEPGRSFAVVSALGGYDVKPQENSGDWFASVYTQSQGATHGALFCTLEQTSADCYFKAIDGAVPDRFTLRTRPTDAESESGFVFSRTDKNEHRWIALNPTGQIGSVWVDKDCAIQLGGTKYRGDWQELLAVAPNLDSLDYPCAQPGNSGGYVHARTDKTEYRWIDRDESGSMGNIWIDKACADQLGGASAWGDWHHLNDIAPGFDSLPSPCD